MASASPYQFLSIPNSVRLLRLQRAADGSITGQLQAVSLDSPACPSFTTLSYVWGLLTTTHSITLDGHQFPVLDSLYPVLEAICNGPKFDPEGWYWIDSICINQADIEERAAQVQLMGRLYASSSRTAVWLGPSNEQNDRAMDYFVRLSDRRDELEADHIGTGLRGMPPDLRDAEEWRNWGTLLQVPWWRRVWTLQEFVVSRRLDFHCGARKTFTRKQFHRAMYAFHTCAPGPDILPDHIWLAAWNRRRLRQWFDVYPGDIRLLGLMAYTSDSAVTDPRDRMYGILGLAAHADQLMVGQPSYREEVGVLYSKLTRAFIKSRASLDIICFSELFGGPQRAAVVKQGEQPLPSWVPDWRIRVQSFVIPLMISQSANPLVGNLRPVRGKKPVENPVSYAASRNRAAKVVISDDFRRLTCSGFVVGVIDGLGGIPQMDRELVEELDLDCAMVQSTSNSNTNTSSRSAYPSSPLLYEIASCIVLDRKDRYLSVPVPVVEFLGQFTQLASMVGQVAGTTPSAPAYDWFFEWLRANQDLRIRGSTIKRHLDHALGSADPPSDIDLSTAPEDGVASRLHDSTSLQRMRKRLITTEKGYLGMAPVRARKGDVICVLLGCNVPVLLREKGREFEFVGECYVGGVMDGRDLNQTTTMREFVLI